MVFFDMPQVLAVSLCLSVLVIYPRTRLFMYECMCRYIHVSVG